MDLGSLSRNYLIHTFMYRLRYCKLEQRRLISPTFFIFFNPFISMLLANVIYIINNILLFAYGGF